MLSKSSWILFLITVIKIFKDDENLLANVTFHTKLFYWSSSMSESQQGPEICDVINAKPTRFMLHLYASLRSMAVLSSRAQERRSRQIRARRARERARKVVPAPISSRFLCPRPPLLLSAPNQNRHATQAIYMLSLSTDSSFLRN